MPVTKEFNDAIVVQFTYEEGQLIRLIAAGRTGRTASISAVVREAVVNGGLRRVDGYGKAAAAYNAGERVGKAEQRGGVRPAASAAA